MKYKFGILLFCMVAVLAFSASAALPVTLDEVKVDGTELTTGSNNRLDIERDQSVPVRVELTSTADLDDVEVSVFISGFEHNDRQRISDYTPVFDMDANTTYVKRFDISLSDLVDEDNYKLRVLVTDRDGDELISNFNLKLDIPRHSVVIEDVLFSPEGYVRAGRALLATVRVANRGEKEEEGVRVQVRIPDLGVSASDFIEELEEEGSGNDDEITSEELYIRIPQCARPGSYDVEVEVRYNDGFDVTTQKTVIEVLEDDACPDSTGTSKPSTPQTIINVGTVSQDIAAGSGGATYPITVTNGGSNSRTYTVGVSGVGDWARASVTPTNTVVLGGGETQTMYVFVQASDDAGAGQRMFSVSVASDGKVLKQIPLSANVAGEAREGGVKRALEIGLVILVVLLVILGLIIGFNKLKGSEEGGDESQTYY
tara:strand:- start:9011 stop:10294 length:1284 start_codon:yes stop_codon:yes gene_type:complete